MGEAEDNMTSLPTDAAESRPRPDSIATWQARLTGPTARKGVTSVIDQAIVSGVNFLTALLLARYTGKGEFGAFTLAFATLMLITGLQGALVTGPMAVLGASRDEEGFRSYATALGAAQLAVAAALTAVALVAAGVMYLLPSAAGLRGTFLGMAVAVFFVLAQEFVRRTLFARLEARGVLVNDIVFRGLQAAGVVALLFLGRRAGAGDAGWLSGRNVFLLLGGSAALASVLGLWQIRRWLGGGLGRMREHLGENWRFGRWALGAQMGGSLTTMGTKVIVAAFGGLAGAATLEAPRLLLAPLQILSIGGRSVLTPRASQKYAEGGKRGLLAFMLPAAVVLGTVFIGYAAVVAIAPELWLGLLYGDKYAGAGTILVLWAAVYALMGLKVLPGTTLAVLRRPDAVMYVALSRGALCAVAVTALAAQFGSIGGTAAVLVTEVVAVVSVSLLCLALLRRIACASSPGNSCNGHDVVSARSGK